MPQAASYMCDDVMNVDTFQTAGYNSALKQRDAKQIFKCFCISVLFLALVARMHPDRFTEFRKRREKRIIPSSVTETFGYFSTPRPVHT